MAKDMKKKNLKIKARYSCFGQHYFVLLKLQRNK